MLVVDDNAINRKVLSRILEPYYDIIEAENGQDAYDQMISGKVISGIMLDLYMPVLDGFGFIELIKNNENLKSIPLIVLTAGGDRDNEVKVLKSGAWDFVSKPYDPEIVIFRLKNALDRSDMAAFEQLKYLSEYDTLTGIYNKSMFCKSVSRFLKNHPDGQYVIGRFDINHFKIINSYFGFDTGDKLLKNIANKLKVYFENNKNGFYCRIDADMFAFFCEYDSEKKIVEKSKLFESEIKEFDFPFEVTMTFGYFIVSSFDVSTEQMLDRAAIALKKVKGNFIKNYSFFTSDMEQEIMTEQEIANSMNNALMQNQFFIEIQPKFELVNETVVGGEALVRWNHPERGLIMPGEFIPILEKNGFVSKVDIFVWTEVCTLLKRWIVEGRNPKPISVNISRASLVNPDIVQILCNLTSKYNVPKKLLELEITESAYMDNPYVLIKSVQKLRAEGFVVLMDDFGSGYSTLGLLKDIEFDILKIDMRLLVSVENQSRAGNIVASVISMAKWLKLPVISEGVENEKQVAFLKSLGCNYAQGFYFSQPIDCDSYIDLDSFMPEEETEQPEELIRSWTPDLSADALFMSIQQPAAAFEFSGNIAKCVKVNNAFIDDYHNDNGILLMQNALDLLDDEYRMAVLDTLKKADSGNGKGECVYLKTFQDNELKWIDIKITIIDKKDGISYVVAVFNDITMQKKAENELEKYKRMLSDDDGEDVTILLIGSSQPEAEILRSIFGQGFSIIRTESCAMAENVLQDSSMNVDAILADTENAQGNLKLLFDSYANSVPVIIITSESTQAQQLEMLFLGASDYIIKPFVSEIVVNRVRNAIESNRRFSEVLRAYRDAIDIANADPLTQVYNRSAIRDLVTDAIAVNSDDTSMFIMIDIDNFKFINDEYGHVYGDDVIVAFARKLLNFFRSYDVIGRMGGDEFCILMKHVRTERDALNKCIKLCDSVSRMSIGANDVKISCSVGIASLEGQPDFAKLYRDADVALYEAKRRGRNCAVLYDKGRFV